MRAITKQGTGGSYHLSQSHATPPQTPEQATSRWGSFGHKAQELQSLIDQHIEKGWSLAHLAQIDLLPSAGKLNRFFSLTQIERQASGFSPRFERSGRDGLLLLNVLPQYFNRGTAA